MNNISPPKLTLRFLRLFCHPSLHVYIEGDLLELYEERVETLGKRKANYKLFIDVLLLFRPSIIRPMVGVSKLNNYGMYRNYVIISWRNLVKHKLYAFINIGGLSVGLGCFILMFLYVEHELSYDKSFDNVDNIYRVYSQEEGDYYLGSDFYAVTPAQLASTLMDEYPEVDRATSISVKSVLLEYDQSNHYWKKGIYANSNFFLIFSYQFVQGSPEGAFEIAESIVLTESLASKIFKEETAMGQVLKLQNKSYIVSGIIQDPPDNTSMNFSFVVNLQTDEQYLAEFKKDRWDGSSYYTFFTLGQHAKLIGLQNKMPQLIYKYWTKDAPFPIKYYFEPLSDLHLQQGFNNDFGGKGNWQQLLLFSVVGVLVLVLACINYMNLAIAQSIDRAKEVGLRKVIGAQKRQLIFQFLIESVLLASITLVFALLLVKLLLPIFEGMVERPLDLSLNEIPFLIPGLVLLVIILGLLSGSYPALYMSSLRPVQVLKGKVRGNAFGINLQKWLIVGQYVTSTAMVVCSLIIYQQFEFIKTKELGFEKEHIVTVRSRGQSIRKNFASLRNEWSTYPSIIAVATSNNLPTNVQQATIINDDKGGDPENDLSIYTLRVNYDFFEVYEIELITGQTLSRNYLSGAERTCVINESAAKAMGWLPSEAVGQKITDNRNGDGIITGVVKDFHMHSMHLPIAPMMIEPHEYFQFISIKIRPDNIQKTLAYLEESMQQYSTYPFEYQFLDDHFNQLYKEGLRQGQVFGFFTILAILIASLGLFGLAAFNTRQRLKEVGIRKVLGASVSDILIVFTKNFMKLVGLGFLIAVPIAWYAMHHWLQDFAYRISIQWWMFAFAGIIAVVIAFIAICSQSVRAALANPVDTLKNE